MCVLINGKPAKELANGVVKIPFGEYAIRFRNKNNRRAMVTITIDGEEAGGNGYIIPANDYIDIERWANKPIKFKFVSLESEDAVDFGKNGPNEDKVKGTIEARFYLEKEAPQVPVEHHHHHHHYPKPTYQPPIWYTTSGCINYSSNINRSIDDNVNELFTLKHVSPPTRRRSRGPGGQSQGGEEMVCGQSLDHDYNAPLPSSEIYYNCEAPSPVKDGCTVEGTYSRQTFRTVWFDAEDDYVALKIFLQGFDKENQKAQPVHTSETVKSKKLRELEEENRRLKAELERKKLEEAETEVFAKLEEENRKLRESLGESK